MGPKRFYSQNFSLIIVKFKQLGFSDYLKKIFLEFSIRYASQFITKNQLQSEFATYQFLPKAPFNLTFVTSTKLSYSPKTCLV